MGPNNNIIQICSLLLRDGRFDIQGGGTGLGFYEKNSLFPYI